jgi:hypothetical protein
LLVQVSVPNPNAPTVSSTICDLQGNVISSPSLPPLGPASQPNGPNPGVSIIGTDKIYSVGRNAIYSLSTGSAVWTTTDPLNGNGQGAIAGSYAVFASGHRVLAESF